MAVAIFQSPSQPTSLLGRSAELEEIVHRLSAAGVRLLTLVGPAGVGKTRVALAAGDRLVPAFSHGVVFVDLAGIRDPRLVLPTLSKALGLLETGDRPLLEQLQQHLHERSLLLILDNFEHVLSAAQELPPLLAAAPGTAMLVTSREPLHLRWERTFRIPPLALPDVDMLPPLEDLLQVPSVALFVERARAQRADFELGQPQAEIVARLVCELDGVPLAIELAAARTNVLPLAVIARRLGDRLRLLQWEAGDLPERHQSLEAAIGWSYDLLPPSEQRLFRHLGVFVGQVELGAIASVLGGEEEDEVLAGLISLAERSLILPSWGDVGMEAEPAFGMLETVRKYACDQLERQGELEDALAAHARYFLALAERAVPELTGREQLAWYGRLEREHDNLRIALRRLLGREEQEDALRLATALGWFWLIRGYRSEGWRWLEETLSRTTAAHPAFRARALLPAGLILNDRDELDQAKIVLDEALMLARSVQDPRGVAEAMTYLGGGAVRAGNVAEGLELLHEALARWRELGEPSTSYQVGLTYGYLAAAAFQRNDLAGMADLLLQTLARHDASGDQHSASATRFYLAPILAERGDLQQGIQLLREGLAASRPFNDRLLLSLGVDATLCLVTAPASLEQRVRLLGARDALREVTNVLTRRLRENVEALRHASQLDKLRLVYQEGRSLTPAEITDLALEVAAHGTDGPPAAATSSRNPAVESPLSEREQEVLRLVAEGLTSKQIGQQLFLSHRTVDHHLTSIYNKLGVDNRAQAVAVATREGYLPDGGSVPGPT